jgi:DNA-binding response OmpR family regulator
MTLKNKKMQLLENDDVSEDVIDIFDQYVGTEDNSVSAENTDVTNKTTTSSINMPEKKWESDNFDKSDVKDVSTVRHQTTSSLDFSAKRNINNTSQTNDIIENVNNNQIVSDSSEEINKKNLDSQDVLQNDKEWERDYETENTMQIIESDKKESINDNIINEKLVDDNSDQELEIPNTIVKKSKSIIQNDNLMPQEEVQIDTNKKTILIVDDDIDTLEMYANVFKAANYNVLGAFDGLEAISLLGDHTPDVIFTGIVMPRMDGFAMLETLKENERTANIPVVINSHLGRDTDKNRAKELGAKDFVIRGFTQPKEVLARIDALLLKSEYILKFDSMDMGIRKLVQDLGTSKFLKCPKGQEIVLKLNLINEQKLTFSARFTCVDTK